MRVVVAAESRLYREGIALALAAAGPTEVVGTAGTDDETLACSLELRPDVVVADMAMPHCEALVLQLTRTPIGTRVVVLGVSGNTKEIIELAEAGISGYVTRDESLATMIEKVQGAARGELVCPPEVAGSLMRRIALLAEDRGPPGAPTALSRLTRRETEILSLIAAGRSNKEIARLLSIQLATVKNHVRSILEKLQVARRGEAAALLRNEPSDQPLRNSNGHATTRASNATPALSRAELS